MYTVVHIEMFVSVIFPALLSLPVFLVIYFISCKVLILLFKCTATSETFCFLLMLCVSINSVKK